MRNEKFVMSLLLSLVLIVTSQVGYSLAELAGPESKINSNYSCNDKHQVRLEEKAKEMGITVDELKAKMKADRQAKLEEKAQELGITVDELKSRVKTQQ